MNQKSRIINWLTIYVLGNLVLIPLVSAPNLIEGISYFKLLVGLLTIPAIYGMLFLIHKKVSDLTLIATIIALIMLHLAVAIVFKIDYRSVFGAPGRNNGLLNLIMLLNFLIFGVIIFHTRKKFLLLKSLGISSALVSVVAIDFWWQKTFTQ